MRTLVAEDHPVYQAVLRKLLGDWGYEVELVSDGEAAWEVLRQEGAPRLAILDWMMPRLDGVEVCRRIRALRSEPYTYVILLTARRDPGDLVMGMDAGADDYVSKPFEKHELRVRLRAGSRIVQLQDELVAARESLRDLAAHDALTRLWNRRAVLDILSSEVERASRGGTPLTVLMVDLDHFKEINDRLGHLCGDEVLREAARRMAQVVRRTDAIGRYGGEEFIVVLPGCSVQEARQTAERIRGAICGAEYPLENGPVRMTASVGVAWTAGMAQLCATSLLRGADSALYRAKNQGRNQTVAAMLDSTGEAEQSEAKLAAGGATGQLTFCA